MLSPPIVGAFSVAVDVNSNVLDFYFLIWSLSRLSRCVGFGSNVVAAWGYNVRGPTWQGLLFPPSAWLCTEWKLTKPFGSGSKFTAVSSDGVQRWTNCLSAATAMFMKLSLPCKGPTKGLVKWVYSENRMLKGIIEPKGETATDSWRKRLTGKHRGLLCL
jgi:hypothetical protein